MKLSVKWLLSTGLLLVLAVQEGISADFVSTSVRFNQNALSKTMGGGYNPEMHPVLQNGLIGKVASGNTLSLSGAFLAVSKNPGEEICSAKMYYRVQQSCNAAAAFEAVDLSYAYTLGGADYWSFLGSENLLAGLNPGFYTVQVYWEVAYQNFAIGTCSEVIRDNRSGMYHTGVFEYDATDSFSDGNFSAGPAWTGNTTSWLIIPQASSGPSFSDFNTKTLRLNAPTISGKKYLATALTPMRDAQDWSFILGRRDMSYTGTTPVYIWLYGNLSNLVSSNIDGYRLKIGDNSGGDEIVLEKVTNNVGVPILTSSGSIPNNLTDISFTVRVTRSAAGSWNLYTSALPVANGGGVNFWRCPQTESTVFQGSVTDNTYVPGAFGYFGLVALHTNISSTCTAVEFDQFQFVSSWNEIPGCTNESALNFNPEADVDNGTCIIPDCPLPSAAISHCYAASENTVWTYRSENISDRVAIFFKSGEFQSCCDYVAVYDGPTTSAPMIYQGSGNIAGAAIQSTQEFLTIRIVSNATSSCSDGLYLPLEADVYCGELYIPGCTYTDACNYNENATFEDGSCDYSCYGCTDLSATNYVATATIEDGSCAYTSPRIIISEIHHTPCVELGGNAADFIELYNPRGVSLTMSGWILSGLKYTFPAGFTMLPYEYIVIARSDAYYSNLSSRVFKADLSDNDLSNAGEEITVRNSFGTVMDYVKYGSVAPWPLAANGLCASMEVLDLGTGNYYPANWQSSYVDGGTPGEANSNDFGCTVCGSEGFDEYELLSESFETGLGAWTASPAGSWAASSPGINGSAGLNHVSQGGAISRVVSDMGYLPLAENCVFWKMELALGSWDPDNDDKFMIYLVSDKSDLSAAGLNGYAIGLNFGATNDQICLYRITNGTPVSTLMCGKLDVMPNGRLGVEVVKDNQGFWMLRYDMDGGFDRMFNVRATPVMDLTHSGGKYFGVALHHTSGGAEEAFVLDDISIERCGAANTWYSVASGNSADAVWSRNPDAAIGQFADFNSFIGVVIQSGHTIVVNNTVEADDLIIEAGATLDGGTSASALSFAGDLTNNGVFIPGNASMAAVGTGAQVIGGTSPFSFHRLSINNSDEVSVETPVEVLHLLEPLAGDLQVNGLVTLAGNETYTGYVGPLATGADVIGNLNYQLYLQPSALAQGWVNIGAPCAGLTIADLDDDIITTGFAGAEFPLANFNNVLTYDEAVPGAWEQGYVGAQAITDGLSTEKAYFLYEFGDAITIDAAGPLRKGNVNIPLHHTNTGNPDGDGWNFVYNVYPAPIDLNALTQASFPSVSGSPNVTYYFWNGEEQTYDVYQAFTGIGEASRYPAPFQPFFVQTNFETALSFNEQIKAVEHAGLSIYRNATDVPVIEFSAGTESKRDKAFLRLSEDAEIGYDAADARKLIAPSGNTVQIALVNSEGTKFSIDSRPNRNEEIVAGIFVKAEPGEYSLRVDDLASFPQGWCLQLTDLVTLESVAIEKGIEIPFVIDESYEGERFRINATPIAEVLVTNAACITSPNGKIEASIAMPGMYNYSWYNEVNTLLSSGASDDRILIKENLLPGTYYLVLQSDVAACKELTIAAVVEGGEGVMPAVTVSADKCNNSGDGKILMDAENQDIYWSVRSEERSFFANGEGDIALQSLNAGMYTVELLGDCFHEEFEVNLADSLAIDSEVSYTASAEQQGTLVTFHCVANENDSFVWHFDNGRSSYEQHPEVLFEGANTAIKASLAISNGVCMEEVEMIVIKEGVLEAEAASYRVENGDSRISIISSLPFAEGSIAEVFDLKGSAIFRGQTSDNHRLDISTTNMASGMYIFNLTQNGEVIHSFKFTK
jgi:hypothetical protein